MTDDRSSRTPPTESDARSLDRPAAAGGERVRLRPGLATVTATAAAVGTRPIDLPPLNETVDMDALDSLFAEESGDAPWPVIEFGYAERRVRISPDRGVTLTDPESVARPLEQPWPHVSPISTPRRRDLLADTVLAIADRSEYEPPEVRDELAEMLDFDALGALSRTRPNGVERPGATVRFSALGFDVVVGPNGTVSVGSALERLRQVGGNVLIVGDAPDSLVESAGAALLGESQHRRVLALLDRDVETVSDYLSPSDAASAHVINHATAVRSTAAVQSQPSAHSTLSVTDVTGELEDVRDLIETKLEALSTPAGDGGGLRFSLASLRPVLEECDAGGARSFLEPICASVADHRVLGSYLLPVARDTDPVPALEALFDATLELRVNGTVAEQRWHLHGSEHTTEWVPLG